MDSARVLNLNWNNFGDNLKDAIKDIKNDKDFHDVTLLCDDEIIIHANKFVLSICSSFFKGLFKKTSLAPSIVYLKGVSSKHMESILSFIYYGSTDVNEDELTTFLEIAKDLKINGLIDGKEKSEIKSESNVNDYSSCLLVVDETNISLDPEAAGSNTVSQPWPRVKPERSQGSGQFTCTLCGKSFSYKHVLENHIETHMDNGNAYNCELCNKFFKTKNSLKSHLSQRHRNY